MDEADAERTLRDQAAADTGDAQVDDLRRLWADIHWALAGGTGPIRYWQAALATRVDAFAPPRAQIRLACWRPFPGGRRPAAGGLGNVGGGPCVGAGRLGTGAGDGHRWTDADARRLAAAPAATN